MREVVICDDSALERSFLRDMLEDIFKEAGKVVSVVEYQSGEKLVADMEDGLLNAELIFLDIHMSEGEINGMVTAHRLRELGVKTPLVFLTATSDYAVESYDVQAAAYILKPYEKEKIVSVLHEIFDRERSPRVAVKCKRQYRYPRTSEIMYIESEKHVVKIHLSDGTEIVTSEKLGELERKIDESRFLKCHQSYLINMNYVEDADDGFVLTDGTKIPIRVRGRKEVIDTYFRYFNKQKEE